MLTRPQYNIRQCQLDQDSNCQVLQDVNISRPRPVGRRMHHHNRRQRCPCFCYVCCPTKDRHQE